MRSLREYLRESCAFVGPLWDPELEREVAKFRRRLRRDPDLASRLVPERRELPPRDEQ
jgi:hypothetical protein